MTEEIYLPRLGSTTMSHGVVVEWLVKAGDTVEVDQPLVEIETDKTNIEVPSPAAGVVLQIVAGPGDEVPVGGTLGYVGEPGGVAPPAAGGPSIAPTPANASAPPPPAAVPPAEVGAPGRASVAGAVPAPVGPVRAAPAARRRAAELGVDLRTVTGSGPDGRIQLADVLAAAVPTAPAVPSARSAAAGTPATAVAPSTTDGQAPARRVSRQQRVRRTTARRMAESAREVAAVTLTREVDVTSTNEAIAEARRAGTARPGLLDFVVVASARALKAHPQVNGSYSDEAGVVPQDVVSVGFAVQTDVGLFVPTLRDIDGWDPARVWRRRRELTESALADRLAADDLGGSSFTVSNLGPFGVDVFTPIVNLPQVAVLGLGRLREGVTVVGGQPAVRPLMWLSLTFDHRAVDGAPAAAFLDDVAARLEAGSG